MVVHISGREAGSHHPFRLKRGDLLEGEEKVSVGDSDSFRLHIKN